MHPTTGQLRLPEKLPKLPKLRLSDFYRDTAHDVDVDVDVEDASPRSDDTTVTVGRPDSIVAMGTPEEEWSDEDAEGEDDMGMTDRGAQGEDARIDGDEKEAMENDRSTSDDYSTSAVSSPDKGSEDEQGEDTEDDDAASADQDAEKGEDGLDEDGEGEDDENMTPPASDQVQQWLSANADSLVDPAQQKQAVSVPAQKRQVKVAADDADEADLVAAFVCPAAMQNVLDGLDGPDHLAPPQPFIDVQSSDPPAPVHETQSGLLFQPVTLTRPIHPSADVQLPSPAEQPDDAEQHAYHGDPHPHPHHCCYCSVHGQTSLPLPSIATRLSAPAAATTTFEQQQYQPQPQPAFAPAPASNPTYFYAHQAYPHQAAAAAAEPLPSAPVPFAIFPSVSADTGIATATANGAFPFAFGGTGASIPESAPAWGMDFGQQQQQQQQQAWEQTAILQRSPGMDTGVDADMGRRWSTTTITSVDMGMGTNLLAFGVRPRLSLSWDIPPVHVQADLTLVPASADERPMFSSLPISFSSAPSPRYAPYFTFLSSRSPRLHRPSAMSAFTTAPAPAPDAPRPPFPVSANDGGEASVSASQSLRGWQWPVA